MRTLVWLMLATVAQAATVTIPNPPGLAAPVTIAVTPGGVLRWNTPAVALGSPRVVSGACTLDTVTVGVHGQLVVIGATCADAGVVTLTTTSQLSYTCPGDGLTQECLHLTLRENGMVFYDQELWPSPVVCYVTAARPAVVMWDGLTTLTFDNRAQARPSAETAFQLVDPAWKYSAHTFTVPSGLTCAATRTNTGTRFKPVWKETGFRCSGVVAASAQAVVVVQ